MVLKALDLEEGQTSGFVYLDCLPNAGSFTADAGMAPLHDPSPMHHEVTPVVPGAPSSAGAA
jgi:hypothetical protein